MDVMDFIVRVAGTGNPSAGEVHKAAAMDGFTTAVEIAELVGNVAGKSADGVPGKVADSRHDRDGCGHNDRADQAADAKRHERQSSTDSGSNESAGDRSCHRSHRPSHCRVVSNVSTDLAVKCLLAKPRIHP